MIGPSYIVTIGIISAEGVAFLGTGFFVGKDKVATSRHVVKGHVSNIVISPSEISSYSEYQDTTLNKNRCIRVDIIEEDPVRDLCILKLAEGEFSGPVLNIGNTDSISVGEQVGILGYPHCNEGRKVLTFQTAIVGAKVLLSNSNVKTKHAILNLQTRPGQSGSLIFNLKNNAAIGVLIGAYANKSMGYVTVGNINPADLHQTTHAVSAEYLKDML